ncbi:MAG TPA: DUF5996 family protein [Kofleriaceae bacterium]|nr:DUF5996 family protein [Kofleriaceae bacterium]
MRGPTPHATSTALRAQIRMGTVTALPHPARMQAQDAHSAHTDPAAGWPELPLDAWRDTRETLHRWMQVVGKIKLGLTPVVNHWWNVVLHVSPRGFTTGTIPNGERWFEIEFDLVDDLVHVRTSDGGVRSVRLAPRSVADFYSETMMALRAAGIEARIWPVPVEIDNPIRLDQDSEHRSYDKDFVRRFWRIAAMSSEIMLRFRSRFIGKASPVGLFWGTFDLSTSRFSGRRAPGPLPANPIEREAYSHEVHSVGWWPGDSRLPKASYFSYIAPEPAGYRHASIATPGAYYNEQLRGFYLHYDDVRSAPDPRAVLLAFFQQTYEAAANLAGWNRAELERDAIA